MSDEGGNISKEHKARNLQETGVLGIGKEIVRKSQKGVWRPDVRVLDSGRLKHVGFTPQASGVGGKWAWILCPLGWARCLSLQQCSWDLGPHVPTWILGPEPIRCWDHLAEPGTWVCLSQSGTGASQEAHIQRVAWLQGEPGARGSENQAISWVLRAVWCWGSLGTWDCRSQPGARVSQ